MQWLMLQQDEPEDFVIATGKQYSVRQFIEKSAQELGFEITWQGVAEDEVGIVSGIGNKEISGFKSGDIIVRVDPRYYRPTEVETLLGDPAKAREKLGWVPKTSFDELVAEMVCEDLQLAQRDAMIKKHGFKTFSYHE
jgi:GDPmannose 4,6-dehydratase